MSPSARCKAHRPTLGVDSQKRGPTAPSVARQTIVWRRLMNATTPPSRRSLTARRVALMATTIAGFGAAALFAPYAAPKAGFFSAPAYAQNLTQQAQQLAQKPIGFADIVEKVKPAVISVRVKMERPAEAGPSSDELPFPPGSPFERFFKRFGMPKDGQGGH